jgi:DNA-binding beta-propeller fold protein YncE
MPNDAGMIKPKISCLLWFFLLHSLISVGQPPENVIYFTDASYNFIFRLQNNKVDTIISSGLGFPWRLATDGANLFWTSVDTNLVEKASLDGFNRQELAVITYPEGIAINDQSGDIYVSEAGTPAIIKLSPPDYVPDTLYLNGLMDPDNITFSTSNDKLYWLDVAQGKIMEAHPDGKGMTTLFANSRYEPMAITIDRNAKYIYWADEKKKGIGRLDIKSKKVEMLVDNLVKPTAVDLNEDNTILFWIDVGTRTIGWKVLGELEVNSLQVEQISNFHGGLLVITIPTRE